MREILIVDVLSIESRLAINGDEFLSSRLVLPESKREKKDKINIKSKHDRQREIDLVFISNIWSSLKE